MHLTNFIFSVNFNHTIFPAALAYVKEDVQYTIKLTEKLWLKLRIRLEAKIFTLFKLAQSKKSFNFQLHYPFELSKYDNSILIF